MHHFLWHNVRALWNNLDSKTQSAIKNLGWAPPNPSVSYTNGTSKTISNNSAGEDFLYMHRQMIADVNKILRDNNQNKLVSWKKLPAPGDKDFPVPAEYKIVNQSGTESTIKKWKASDFYWSNIKPLEDDLNNVTKLRNMTLGQLGTKIEFGVHSYLHLRFSSSNSYGYRMKTTAIFPEIDKKWDDPKYNWLVDVYSSHLNPSFWKLHGWVDGRIGVWMKANNLNSIKWKGTWTGGPMKKLPDLLAIGRSLAHGHGHNYLDETMAEVFRLLAKTGKEYKFEQEVSFDFSFSKPHIFKYKLKRRG